ncbi:SHOCT domain-containing protein [Thalassotalea sp. LPB0316]|uniref:SHOCT domain-containing protein n=1 Tax=Thalassotalea sp. LPB0316 TaxID=2769490 RepID=UPI00186627D6|nr:SHOCT domain-containing protein [Thalassotalea sp. LPB0316]QOL26197.1 SHOCT domain-containing protein [Thalassotalea sp. LPB0316]
MGNQGNTVWLSWRIYYTLLCSVLLLTNYPAQAITWQVKLPEYLSTINTKQLIKVPQQERFFAFTQTGEIYLLGVEESSELVVHHQPILNLQQALAVESVDLLAVALHPSFSTDGQAGHTTFYTAQRIPFERQSGAVRLAQQSDKNIYDVVVTEWVYLAHSQAVAVNSKRELFRIASSNRDFGVEQLSFNPHIKPWQDNFGLLHVLLSASKSATSPLYSGSLLRINPTPFGLKQYTVPINNPYKQQSNLIDELVLHNIEQPKALVWQKNSHNDFLLHHYHQGHPVVSSVGLGENMLAIKPEYQFFIKDKQLFSGLHYFSTNQLDTSPTYLTTRNDNNQLSHVSFVEQQAKLANSSLLDNVTIPRNSHLIKVAEPIMALYAKSERLLTVVNYQLAQGAQQSEVSIGDVETHRNGLFLYLTFAILISLIIWLNREKLIEEHAKRKIRQQYGKVSIIDGEISLYNRHQETIALTLASQDIASSELLLNQQRVNLVDRQANPFSNETETEVKGAFNREYHLKMYGKRVRQVQLCLTDKQGKKYLICPYFRIGDQRYTRLHFKPSLALLIDFQWQLSTLINPQATPERKKEIVPDKSCLKPATQIPQSGQSNQQLPFNKTDKEDIAEQPVSKQQTSTDTSPPQEQKLNDQLEKLSDVQDTKIIDALEKLAKLHQQGFIDDAEFLSAKTKLLQSLVDQ